VLDRRDYQVVPFWQVSNENNAAVIDHSGWQDILDEYLISDDPSGINFFDYQVLQEEGSEDLAAYLAQMTSLDPRDYNRAEQFAYWVNLYNALTVRVIIDHYPVESITQISEQALAFGPWDDVVSEVAGQPVTLNDIEHRILRPIWLDHRIHFAVNCASIGCPNIQIDAFTSVNTDALLDSAARDYLQHPRALQITENGLLLSSIFDWYKGDFGENQTEVLATLSLYLTDEQRTQVQASSQQIRYDYDWSLNDAPN